MELTQAQKEQLLEVVEKYNELSCQLKQIEEKSAEKALVLKTDVDAYSGATISSKALNAAVNAAIEAYNMIP